MVVRRRGVCDLVAHVQQGAQGEAEGEALVVAHKVAHILQQEVARPVQVTVAQVRHHLHHRIQSDIHTLCAQVTRCM